jgi:hypothetical protein
VFANLRREIATGIELPFEVEICRNFIIGHSRGMVISGYAKFGDNRRIRNGVVGLRRVDEPCAPVIGNNVDIGAGPRFSAPSRRATTWSSAPAQSSSAMCPAIASQPGFRR